MPLHLATPTDVTRPPEMKRVLYFGASAKMFRGFFSEMAAAPGCSVIDGEPDAIKLGELPCQWLPRFDATELLRELRTKYVNLVVLDLRGLPGQLKERAAFVFKLLESLDQSGEIEERYAFHRIMVLVSGSDSTVDDVILKLGTHGVRQVLRQEVFPAEEGAARAFAGRVATAISATLQERLGGKRALCAAGGGTTGVFFELGALKCIDDCLPDGGVNAFDMYFGISAGAVVNCMIASGYSVDEIMSSIANVPGGRIEPLDLNMVRLGHVNFRDLAERVRRAAGLAVGGLAGLVGLGRAKRETSLFELADLLTPPFRSDRAERILRSILTSPGACNDFRRLPKPLFVGATDQDARQHVLFGDKGYDDVPISLAVQASMSINPAFSATYIRGRYYEDGAVTRTSNFAEAIRRGASLILVIDPFVPYVAREPGFAGQRGVLYNIDQNVRTVSFTRYETTRDVILRRHPEVSAYTFLPANRVRRLMAVNPMDHRPYLEIWRGAYLSTLTRLHRLKHRITGDFHAQGLRLDLARADAVAEQLEGVDHPQLADFFPDRQLKIRLPALALERPARDAGKRSSSSFSAA